MKTSIRTRYRDILFRSKLEADWARAFDALALPWEYEHEGRYFGDVFYLPDFFLPASRQYVEVKGIWYPDDARKVLALLNHVAPRPTARNLADIAIIACNPDGAFWGYRRPEAPITDLPELLLEHNLDVTLRQCPDCAGWWFHAPADYHQCQCCGVSTAGAPLGTNAILSPLAPWPVIGVAA